jgi:Arc/MetJ-type ribon-helix-helix transcriptional regulator
MRKPKPVEERVMNAGVSLPPRFIEEVRHAAKVEGYETLTTLVRYLLTQWLRKTHDKWEAQDLEQEAMRERLKSSELTEPPAPKRKRGRPRKSPPSE